MCIYGTYLLWDGRYSVTNTVVLVIICPSHQYIGHKHSMHDFTSVRQLSAADQGLRHEAFGKDHLLTENNRPSILDEVSSSRRGDTSTQPVAVHLHTKVCKEIVIIR